MSDSESAQEDHEKTNPEKDKKDEEEDDEEEINEIEDKQSSPKKQNNNKEDKQQVKDNNKKSLPPKKSVKKEEDSNEGSEKSEEDEDDDDDDDNEEPKLGLLDRPLEVSGARERKKVERLDVSFATPSKDKHDIPEGQGEKLGDCPMIEYHLQKLKAEELKVLHRILFHRPGSGNEIKKNIRKFSGFLFNKDSAEYEKKKANLDKLTNSVLKQLCDVLDLERSGTKEEIIERVLQFLLKPKASGKKVPKIKKRSSSRSEKKKPKSSEKKEKSSKKSNRAKKSDSSSGGEDEESSEKEESEKSEEEDMSEDDDEDDEDFEVKKKPKAAKKEKKEAPVKDKKEKNEEKTKKADDVAAKPAAKKQKKGSAGSGEEESSDDEPLAKKAKTPPSNAEIKQLVKKILDGADLEEITMKKVIKQVFDDYPEFDLSDKKGFIKSTVKSLIS